LLVPVPEAEATSRWWELWDPPKERGVPAHVTVLYPFLRERDVTSPVLDGLREAFAGAAPFELRIRQQGRNYWREGTIADADGKLLARGKGRFVKVADYVAPSGNNGVEK